MQETQEFKSRPDSPAALDSPSSQSPEGLTDVTEYRQQLHRRFGLLHVCGLALASGSTWVPFGGSLVSQTPIYRGIATALYVIQMGVSVLRVVIVNYIPFPDNSHL